MNNWRVLYLLVPYIRNIYSFTVLVFENCTCEVEQSLNSYFGNNIAAQIRLLKMYYSSPASTPLCMIPI